jgi:hypothetical protein
MIGGALAPAEELASLRQQPQAVAQEQLGEARLVR